jgi:hypothetical protein
MSWISVTDDLPDIDVPVWIWPQAAIFCRCEDSDGWLWANCYGMVDFVNGEWVANDAETDDDYQPTHWMCLPEPPEEKP